jgi:hypothetical protein
MDAIPVGVENVNANVTRRRRSVSTPWYQSGVLMEIAPLRLSILACFVDDRI